MQILTVKDIKLMGDHDEKWGQTYWGTVKEFDVPVRFNLMKVVDLVPGRQILAHEAEQRQGSKTPYMQLKKVSIAETPDEAKTKPVQSAKMAFVPKATTYTVPAEKPAYEAGTNARWALKLAVDTYKATAGSMPTDSVDYDIVMGFAEWLLSAFDKLSTGTQVVAAPGNEASESDVSAGDLDNFDVEDEARFS